MKHVSLSYHTSYSFRTRANQLQMEGRCMRFNVIALSWMLAIISITGHTIILVAMKRGKLIVQPQFMLLVNLAISNIIFATCVGPITTILMFRVRSSEDCVLMMEVSISIGKCFLYSSIFTTVLLNINRYIAIAYALRYHAIVTPERTMKSMILSFIVGVTLGCSEHLQDLFITTTVLINNRKDRTTGFIIQFSLVLFSIIICLISSIVVNISRKKQMQKILSQSKSLYGVYGEHIHWLKKQERKTKGVIFITGSSFLPFILFAVVAFKHLGFPSNHDAVMVTISRLVFFLYTSVSPIIYIFSLGILKNAVVSLCPKKFRKSSVSPLNSFQGSSMNRRNQITNTNQNKQLASPNQSHQKSKLPVSTAVVPFKDDNSSSSQPCVSQQTSSPAQKSLVNENNVNNDGHQTTNQHRSSKQDLLQHPSKPSIDTPLNCCSPKKLLYAYRPHTIPTLREHQAEQQEKSNNLQSASNEQTESIPLEKHRREKLTSVASTHQHSTYAELKLTWKCHQPCSNCTLQCTNVELINYKNVEDST